MRLLAFSLLAALSLCARADDAGRARAASAEARRDSSRPVAVPRTGADTAGIFRRAAGESAESFAARSGPSGGELTHAVIETDAWSPGDTALIAWYRHPSDAPPAYTGGPPGHEATGYAFIPDPAGGYRRVEIGLIGQEGGEPEIRSVFFANADGSPGPELIVMGAWSIRTWFAAGTLYGTHVYALRREPDRFVYLEDVSRAVSGTCDCWRRDEPSTTSRFKTADEVRAGLRALGYR